MGWTRRILTAGLILSATALHAQADKLELMGTLRDFKSGKVSGGHPDFENDGNGSYPLVTGMVKATLGTDGAPVLNVNRDRDIPSGWRVKSQASFGQWFKNVDGVNKSIPHTITLEDSNGNGIYRYEASIHNGKSFFPIDGKLYGNDGNNHNFHFTYTIHTKFTYTDPTKRSPMTFNFSGDDDVWVFINKKLAVDLGGVHPEKSTSVNIDSLASQLGLEVGKTYDFDFFYCERHTTQSNMTIETTMQFLPPLYD